jgi:NAD(P)-dependent dehydrogenase (short-subunit alcohol dehydrogenase family)
MTERRSLTDLSRLDGQVAVITGGAAGIGLATARRFGEAGCRVVLADIDERVDAAAAELSADGYRATAASLDVTDSDQHHRLAREVVSEHGRLDIWVNNAGIFPSRPVLEMTPDDWRRVMAVNLDGVFFGAQAAASMMVPRGRGVILNVVSTSGFRVSQDGVSHYASSKSGLRGLIQALAREFGPHGVRVLGIAPGFTSTEAAVAQLSSLAAARGEGVGSSTVEGLVDAYLQRIPLRRIAEPDDMATVALFCVSGLAGYVTGSVIPVDGGYLAV